MASNSTINFYLIVCMLPYMEGCREKHISCYTVDQQALCLNSVGGGTNIATKELDKLQMGLT